MAEFLVGIWAWLTRKEKSSVAIDGFDRLSSRQEKFNQQILDELVTQSKRLDDCDKDRDDLRKKVGVLDQKVEDCDEDRTDLRKRVETLEKHSQ